MSLRQLGPCLNWTNEFCELSVTAALLGTVGLLLARAYRPSQQLTQCSRSF